MTMRHTRKQGALIGLLVAVLLLATACPVSQQDAAFQTNRTITSIAEANLGMERSVRKLHELKLVSPEMTNEILNYNLSVAKAGNSAVVILKSGKNWNVIAPEVLKLLREIQLPAKVSAFVHQPAADVGVQGLVAIINTIQILVTQSITEVQK